MAGLKKRAEDEKRMKLIAAALDGRSSASSSALSRSFGVSVEKAKWIMKGRNIKDAD